VLLGRNAKRGAAACSLCRDRAPSASVEFIAVDATDPAAAVFAEQKARARLGAIDVLVNTTGPSQPPRLLHETPIEDVRAILDGLILPPLHMMHAVLPGMRDRGGGSIINVSSSGSRRPRPEQLPYSAAKAGLNALTEGFALAFGPTVRVNTLMPGPFLTDISKAWDIGVTTRGAQSFALKRLGNPPEIIGAAMFLASDASSFTTGSILRSDGGIP